MDGVSVTVNGKSAYVYYISPTQVNLLTPPDAMAGAVQVVVSHNGSTSAAFTAQANRCHRRSSCSMALTLPRHTSTEVISGPPVSTPDSPRRRNQAKPWCSTAMGSDQRQRPWSAEPPRNREPCRRAGHQDRRHQRDRAVCRLGCAGRVSAQRGDSVLDPGWGPADHGDVQWRHDSGGDVDHHTALKARLPSRS